MESFNGTDAHVNEARPCTVNSNSTRKPRHWKTTRSSTGWWNEKLSDVTVFEFPPAAHQQRRWRLLSDARIFRARYGTLFLPTAIPFNDARAPKIGYHRWNWTIRRKIITYLNSNFSLNLDIALTNFDMNIWISQWTFWLSIGWIGTRKFES